MGRKLRIDPAPVVFSVHNVKDCSDDDRHDDDDDDGHDDDGDQLMTIVQCTNEKCHQLLCS